MEKNEENIKNATTSVNSNKRYTFEFEEFAWSNCSQHSHLGKNAISIIENERQNIEKDLKLLEIITREKSKQKDLMVSLFQLKEKLEKEIKSKICTY